MIHVLLGLKDKEGNISARAFTSVDAPQLVNFQYSLLNICIIWKSLIDIMQIFKRLYYFFYCLLGRIQSTLLHAEKTSLSIYKGSEGWFLCLLYTFCPHILNSDFWVFPQSGRIVAIEGSNMLILWSPQTFSLYQNQDEELPRLTQSRLEKNDVPPSASSQNICIFQIFYLQHSPSGLNWATMVTVCPAFFRAAAACSCVALDRSTPFTYEYRHTQLAAKFALTRANWKHSQVQVLFW